MLSKRQQKTKRLRRKRRIRKKVFGTPERPRLTVYRSHRHIYAQLIDDVAGGTLVSASTLSRELRGELGSGGTIGASAKVGALLAGKALEAKIKRVVFDRNGFKYHGRVKALAEAVREAGLEF